MVQNEVSRSVGFHAVASCERVVFATAFVCAMTLLFWLVISCCMGAEANASETLDNLLPQSKVVEVEPNDTFESANAIKVGDTVSGQYNLEHMFDQSSDYDYYVFKVDRTAPLLISFASDRYYKAFFGCDLYLSLYDQSYERIDYVEVSTKTRAPSSAKFELAPGTYYLRFAHDWWTSSPKDGHPYHFSIEYTREMFRLYNRYSGEHFYTSNAGERDHLVSVGWKDEGVGWYAPEKSSTPVYRLYNPNVGDHHYTTSKNEKDTLVRVGWKDEGVGWYSGGTKPLYRQYNPNAQTGTHNYTTDKYENDTLVNKGWRAEGIGWYALK